MGTVPVTINGVLIPSGKSADDQPEPVTLVGQLSITGLTVGGGPVIPPDAPPIPPSQPGAPTFPMSRFGSFGGVPALRVGLECRTSPQSPRWSR